MNKYSFPLLFSKIRRKFSNLKSTRSFFKKYSDLYIDIFVFLLLIVLILIFYWPFALLYIVPTQDGAQCLSFYSYLYAGFKEFGKILLWNPYLVGGAEDNLISYIFSGISPSNPILIIWLFISKNFNLTILPSFYYYHLIYILLASWYSYLLGKNFFFSKNLASSIVLAVLTSTSGFLLSVTPQLSFIISYSTLPIILYYCFCVIYKNKTIDYLSLAFWITILLSNSFSTISIGILIYIFIFTICVFAFSKIVTKNLKVRFINIFIFIIVTCILNFPNFIALKNYKEEGYRRNPEYAFIGMLPDIKDSNDYMNFYWILNTFIPNTQLSRWSGIGNGGIFNNTFYYLGFLTPIFVLFGFVHLAKGKEHLGVFTGIILSTIFSVFYFQGHTIVRLFPAWNVLTSYPTHSLPLIIYSIVIVAAYGIYGIFENTAFSVHSIKIRLYKLSSLFIPILFVATILILVVFKLIISPKFDLPVILNTISYCFIIGIFYFAILLKPKKSLLIAILILDIVFYLSSSKALIAHPYRFISEYETAKFINYAPFKIPNTLGYSISKGYPGSHFSIGTTLFRESSIGDILHSFFPRKRAYWAQTYLQDTFKDTDKSSALKLLGVSKARYYTTDSVIIVDDYEKIFKTAKDIYLNLNTSANLDQPKILIETPTIIAKNEPVVLSNIKYELPNNFGIQKYSDEDKDIKMFIENNTIKEKFSKLTIDISDFKSIANNGQFTTYEFTKEIPNIGCLITENTVTENTCITLVDDLRQIYYPITNDIINFSDNYETTDQKYIIGYDKFYAILANKDKPPKLYIRINDTQKPKNLTLFYYTNSINNLPMTFNKQKVIIPSNHFDYWKLIDNKTLVYTTTDLIGKMPSYFGDPIKNYKIKVSDLDTSNTTFSIYNEMLYVYKSFLENPHISKDITVEYNTRQANPNISQNIKINSEDTDDINLSVSCTKNCMLVVRNIYSDDWHASVDNKITKTYPVNGMYIGIPIPNGAHQVSMSYRLPYLRLFIYINYLFAGFLVTLYIANLIIRLKHDKSSRRN